MTAIQLNTARYHGLNLTDLQILLILAEQGPQDLTALAVETSLTNGAITLICRKLVGKFLVQRLRDHWTDGGVTILELTELGRVRIHQITGTFPEGSVGVSPASSH
jgi:DNA-binding MarR family transcriptional regulator